MIRLTLRQGTSRSRGDRRWTHCPDCTLTGGPYAAAEAEHLSDVHDRLHHGGNPTCEVRPASPTRLAVG